MQCIESNYSLSPIRTRKMHYVHGAFAECILPHIVGVRAQEEVVADMVIGEQKHLNEAMKTVHQRTQRTKQDISDKAIANMYVAGLKWSLRRTMQMR